MEIVNFYVQGSEPEPYAVTFERAGEQVASSCSCAAGMKKQSCKHRLRILEGKPEGIVSDNIADVEIVCSWIPGSEIEAALAALAAAERKADEAKREVSRAKKALSRVLEG